MELFVPICTHLLQVDTQQLLAYFPGAQHISVGGNMFPVEQFHLEDVLQATGYCSRQMTKQKQMQRSRQSLEDLTQQLVLGNSRQQAQVEEAEEDLVVVEEEQEETGEDEDEEEEVMVADPAMDHLLGQCFLNGGDDDFAILEQQVMYLASLIDFVQFFISLFSTKSFTVVNVFS